MSGRRHEREAGSVKLSAIEADAGGWDIGPLTVCGRPVPSPRKGEFGTPEEALDAALARAKAFATQENLDLRLGDD